MEFLWACLLAGACCCRSTRPLALLLAAKWAINYGAFIFVTQWSPVFVDLAFGTAGVVMASRHRTLWADVVLAGFILTAIVHAGYWVTWRDLEGTSPLSYYLLVIGLFTAQAFALSWPGITEGGQRVARWMDGPRRRALVGLAGVRAAFGWLRSADK